MKICFLGLDNLPVLAGEYSHLGVGGEQVQQTLLAKALRRCGYDVSMVVLDYGQDNLRVWDGVTTYRSFREDSGLPIVRFLYPRWTRMWSAMRMANADIYYISCAGMQLGLAALFCRAYKRKFIFRVAHDSDCEPKELLIRYWRDKKLYEYGLKRADGILVQTQKQQVTMSKNYGLASHIAEMLVDPPGKAIQRNDDVLWVNNIRPFKRPDIFVELAKRLPQTNFQMIGGVQPGFSALYAKIELASRTVPNLVFHGRCPYQKMDIYYSQVRIFVNTSDTEGFPNSYLQAWIRGTPVVAFFDPDGLIKRERLGFAVSSLDEMVERIEELNYNLDMWNDISERCKQYVARQYNDQRILLPYLDMFQRAKYERNVRSSSD